MIDKLIGRVLGSFALICVLLVPMLAAPRAKRGGRKFAPNKVRQNKVRHSKARYSRVVSPVTKKKVARRKTFRRKTARKSHRVRVAALGRSSKTFASPLSPPALPLSANCSLAQPVATNNAPCALCSTQILSVAASFSGLPYRRGGSNPETGFDCSGFVQHVFRASCNLALPRSARQQFGSGVAIPKEELSPGDLVFFRRGRSQWHVGIYNGEGQFIHSPNSRDSVKLTPLDAPYYRRHFIGARRVTTETLLQIPEIPPPSFAADTLAEENN
jgi:cell wall-associated NlpC family hydrolase